MSLCLLYLTVRAGSVWYWSWWQNDYVMSMCLLYLTVRAGSVWPTEWLSYVLVFVISDSSCWECVVLKLLTEWLSYVHVFVISDCSCWECVVLKLLTEWLSYVLVFVISDSSCWVCGTEVADWMTKLCPCVCYTWQFVLGVCGTEVADRYKSGSTNLHRPLSSGTQSYGTHKQEWPVTEPMTKTTAELEVFIVI